MSDPVGIPDFRTGDEFAALMAGLAGRMHSKNRIWMGESGHVWLLAELMAALGEEFRDGLDDPQVVEDFGDAGQSSTLSEDEKLDRLFARLRARLGR